MYQSVHQHTEDARRVLGDAVLAAIPATRARSYAIFSMERWHPPLLVCCPDRIDVHLGRFVRTGPGRHLSTTPLAEARFRFDDRHATVTTADNTWYASQWHLGELIDVLRQLEHPDAQGVT